MALVTVLDLITDIMVQIGALNQGETPNGSEAVQVFAAINRRLDDWNRQRLKLSGTTELALPLVANQSTYAIGPGAADFNIPVRPFIQHARITIAGSTITLPMELVGSGEWNSIEEFPLKGNRPMKLWSDYNWPQMLMRIWPVPLSACQLLLDVWTLLPIYAALTDTLNLPLGYLLPLQWDVAIDVSPYFQRPLDPTIIQNSVRAEAQLEYLNATLIRGIAPSPAGEMGSVPPGTIPAAQPPVSPAGPGQ